MDIKIIATSVEGFNSIKERLDTIPEQIRDQIISAEQKAHGLQLVINVESHKKCVRLPKNTGQITHFDDYIGCYSENEIFYKIIKQQPDIKIDYLFI